MPEIILPEQSNKSDCDRLVEVLSPLPHRHFKTERAIMDIKGEKLALMRFAPPLFMDNLVRALRQTPKLSHSARNAALVKTAEIFAQDVICGLTAEDYIRLTVNITGLPAAVVKNALHYISDSVALAGKGKGLGPMPSGGIKPDDKQARNGCAQWMRKGDVLAVIAPGNAPGVHAIWPQAVALGYKAVVRLSEREPFTAQRLLAAMIKAGLQDYVALVPADYDGADALVKTADLSLIYGGDAIVRHYAGRADILVQGPGRSKIIIGKDYPRDRALPLIWESVTGLGGTACVCASSVLVEGDAQSLAQDFYDFAKAKFADSAGRREWALQLSKQRFSWLMQIAEQFRDNLAGIIAHTENPDGTYSAMPLIRIAETIRNPLVHNELPVASVSFAPFNRETDLPFLGDTLALTAATADEDLIANLNEQPGIHNLYIGSIPTLWTRPDLPHDGFLSEFLMKARSYKMSMTDEKDLFSVSSAIMQEKSRR